MLLLCKLDTIVLYEELRNDGCSRQGDQEDEKAAKGRSKLFLLLEVRKPHQQRQHEYVAQCADGSQVPDDVTHVGVEDGDKDEDDDEGGV